MTEKWLLERELRDKQMRRALLELLQEATKDKGPGGGGWPEPMLDDGQVTYELQRILKIKGFRLW